MSSDPEIILPGAMPRDGSQSTRGVTRILDLLREEFPGYNTNRDQNVAAAMALTSALGSVGAWVLIRDGEDRFDKFKRMVLTQIDDLGRRGAKLVRERPQGRG